MKESKEILKEIKNIVLDKYPSAKIYLYGSRARSSSKSDSDWDILILLDTDKITPSIEREVTYPLYDLEFDSGEVISPIVFSENDWNSKYKITPFYYNVMKEGQLL